MRTNAARTGEPVEEDLNSMGNRRDSLRAAALANAMRKRLKGVPSYSVPEAAALLSISQEFLYRLIQADGFPAVVMRLGRTKGRYVIPASAIERLLEEADDASTCVDAAEWTAAQRFAGGVA
ncbi:helix-turn-helix domain-containing protein [Actinokineospora sp.]|uniref:helix-turn-helix domain-containing protein n=1 Tax=Actinokineospora sp. TaxID=1872133 RepID=UPI003D6A5574